jgi:hypothetical protein
VEPLVELQPEDRAAELARWKLLVPALTVAVIMRVAVVHVLDEVAKGVELAREAAALRAIPVALARGRTERAVLGHGAVL